MKKPAGTADVLQSRDRGRPQVRPDDETRLIIFEAARHEFGGAGYAATSMETVARRAGVSTKTLYRLTESKAGLFEGMVADRIDRFLATVKLDEIKHAEIEVALRAALQACADLALDKDVVALQRTVLRDAGQFSDIARTFYTKGIQRSAAALAEWLGVQQRRGLIALDDVNDAAGMLLGMVISAPQRAATFGGEPLPTPQQIQARVRTCAALFLRGCEIKIR